MRIRVLISVIVLWSAAFGSAEAQTLRHRVAVKALENPANAEKSTIGNALTEILITELSRAGARHYELVDPGTVADALRGIDFNSSYWAENPLASQQLAGAHYVLAGKVSNFSFNEQKFREQVLVQGVIQFLDRYRQRVDVRVDFRLINLKTGQIALSESGSGSETRISTTSGALVWDQILAGGMFHASSKEGLDSLIGRATIQAVQAVVRKLNDLARVLPPPEAGPTAAEIELTALEKLEGKVLAQVGAETRILGVGKNHSLRVGDRLIVSGEQVIRDQRGQEVYRVRRQTGIVEIVDVDSAPDRSMARVVEVSEAGANIASVGREGDVLKVDMNRARELRQVLGSNSPSGKSEENPIDVEEKVREHIRRGDRFFEDKYFGQALDEYRKADALKPGTYEILSRIGAALLYLGDFYETEITAEQLLKRGDAVEFHVLHGHLLGQCIGSLRIQLGRLSFVPRGGDHGFVVPGSDVLIFTRDFNKTINREGLMLRIRKENKERRYDFVFLVFGEDEGGEENNRRLINLVLRMIRDYVKS
ncbi:MAG: hypothetical protein K6U09_01000 [Acidobacteriia bacterium]|jgi:curli biogenesis system outer membrane secretion channel CsgG|nr:hypothetical protein [Terriglobia bacterium]